MNNNQNLKAKIMRKVYLIWFAKKITPYVLIELAFFAGFITLIRQHVYITKVILYADQILANHSIDPVVWANFIFHIFMKTGFIVQLSVLGSLTMIILMFRNFVASLIQLSLAKETL